MSSLPASQPAEDSEADGATAPSTDDLSSEEPLATRDGARKSVDPPTTGRESNDRWTRHDEGRSLCCRRPIAISRVALVRVHNV